MKTITEMAIEAGLGNWDVDFGFSTGRFAALVKAARDAELLEGVEMPEPVVQRTKDSKEKTLDDWFYASNPAYPKVHSTWKWEFLFTIDQLRETVAAAVAKKDAEIDTLKAENERLRGALKDAVEFTRKWGYFDVAKAEAAMKGQP